METTRNVTFYESDLGARPIEECPTKLETFGPREGEAAS